MNFYRYSLETGIFDGRCKGSSVGGWKPAPQTGFAWFAAARIDHTTERVDLATGELVPREATDAESQQAQRDAAMAQIEAIEATQPRGVREALLELLPPDSKARAQLQAVEDEIADQRQLLRGSKT